MLSIESVVCLIRFVGAKPKGMRDFFPKIGVPAVRKTRKAVTEQFPTTLYTDPKCLQIIKQRDKDSNASYVKEFQAEIAQKLSQN